MVKQCLTSFVEGAVWVCGAMLCLIMLALIMSGCHDEPKQASTATAIPAAIQRYEVPLADTTTIPDMLILRPGQSAVLVEDMIAKAYIPAEGNRLYEGSVRFEKGMVLIKPVKEGGGQ